MLPSCALQPGAYNILQATFQSHARQENAERTWPSAVLQARFQPIDFAADPAAELDYYAGPNGSLGIDGLFTDCPATAVAWWNSTLSTPEAQKERSNEQAEQARGHSILFVFIIVVLVLVVGGPLSCILWALWQRWRRRRQYDNLQDVQTFEMPDTRRFPHEDGHFRQGVSNGAV